MLSYPIRLIPTEDGMVLVRFPDVPEAAAIGATEDEAIEAARRVLDTVLSTYCIDGRAIPSPSDICGAPTIATEKFSVLGLEMPSA